MAGISRRGLIVAGGATALLAACGNGIGNSGAAQIDARVTASERFLVSRYPGTQDLIGRSKGVLWMPLVTEAAFGFGGSFGRGALRISGATVDYYSAAQGSYGLQLGAQQYSHGIFFMTDAALQNFRSTNGWVVGADATYALPDRGGNIGADTTEISSPVKVLVYGQSGFLAGVSLAGTKYTRIIP